MLGYIMVDIKAFKLRRKQRRIMKAFNRQDKALRKAAAKAEAERHAQARLIWYSGAKMTVGEMEEAKRYIEQRDLQASEARVALEVLNEDHHSIR